MSKPKSSVRERQEELLAKYAERKRRAIGLTDADMREAAREMAVLMEARYPGTQWLPVDDPKAPVRPGVTRRRLVSYENALAAIERSAEYDDDAREVLARIRALESEVER